MSRPVVVVIGRPPEHELVLLGLSLLLGAAYLLGAPPPQSAAAQMPGWLVHMWAGGLLVSGATGLASMVARRWWHEAALMAEAGAMLIGAGALVLIVAAVLAAVGVAGLFGAGFSAAWALANIVRAVRIVQELRQIGWAMWTG